MPCIFFLRCAGTGRHCALKCISVFLFFFWRALFMNTILLLFASFELLIWASQPLKKQRNCEVHSGAFLSLVNLWRLAASRLTDWLDSCNSWAALKRAAAAAADRQKRDEMNTFDDGEKWTVAREREMWLRKMGSYADRLRHVVEEWQNLEFCSNKLKTIEQF